MYRVLYDEVFRKETITGGSNEDRVVRRLISIFREFVDDVDVVETPVDTWIEDECWIIYGDKETRCHAMPYILSGEIEAEIAYAEYYGNRIASSKPVRDTIVFIPFPEDPDDIKFVVLKLYEHGVKAVIFYDQLPGRYRRMVLIGDEDYSCSHGSPSPIPAVSVRKEDYLRIVKDNPHRARLIVKTRIIHGATGKTVIGWINGRDNREIHITAHHDHWFTGFSDNLIGVEALIQLGKRIKEKREFKETILLISYTAEESGAPNYTSWYWTWGSRYYLELRDKSNTLENILFDINIDAIYSTPFYINTNPSMIHCIEELKDKLPIRYRGYDHTDFDSFMYTRRGIPALTINNLLEIKHIYHTNLDDGGEVERETIDKAIDTTYIILKCLVEKPPRYRNIIEYLKNNDIPASSNYRNLIGRLENLDKLVEDENMRIRIATKTLTTVSYIPGIDGLFESDLVGDIKLIYRIMKNIEKYIGRRIRAKAIDREQILDVSPTKYNIGELDIALSHMINGRINNYQKQLDHEIRQIILKKYFKP